MSAALYMVKVQSMIRLFASETTDPCKILSHLEQHLVRELRKNYFLTLSLIKINQEGNVEICRAGHLPALYFEAESDACTRIEPAGLAIGFQRGQPPKADQPEYIDQLRVETKACKDGDILFLYTDGVIETFNAKREEFGEERLEALVGDHKQDSSNEIKSSLLETLTTFRQGSELFDDTTFVVLKYAGTNGTVQQITR